MAKDTKDTSDKRSSASDQNADVQELKRRVSPRLLELSGVSGVGIRAGQLVIYLVEESEIVRREVAAILESEKAGTPFNFVVTGAFQPR